LIPLAAQHPESLEDVELPDLPALSEEAQVVADAARAAVVKIELGPDEFGTGVIFDQRGYVLTNQHVVADFSRVVVALADGRRLKGAVVGTDQSADVAVVKISAENLAAVPLGDSSRVAVGDEIVVIGHTPLFGSTATARTGIVRFAGEIPGHSFLPDVIHTDAFVHPGDSGGPLLNLDGEVIGLNEAMVRSRRARGHLLASALPSNSVRAIAEEILLAKELADGASQQ
jgi:serine protease Do